MFDDRELGDAQAWLDEWRSGFGERARWARELSGRLHRVCGTARSPDGLVSVTVGPGGELLGLELDEGIRQRTAADTAEKIQVTVRAAREALAEAVWQATAETVGAESATGRAVAAAYAVRASAGE
ncbi:YbaB/EbfC family nucleoid-associated protein [Actinoplanes sp. NPDC020271]|uniref:YbaB/EbfC family nucleoid-associated protein n=1 Tax=Actinoplanes sp. NPDC020271 TaxID=3363896 RepID=UPI003797DC44